MKTLLDTLALESGVTANRYSYRELAQNIPMDWSAELTVTKKEIETNRYYHPAQMLLDLQTIRKEIDQLARRHGPTISKYRDWAASIVNKIEQVDSKDLTDDERIYEVTEILRKSNKPPLRYLGETLPNYKFSLEHHTLAAEFVRPRFNNLGEYRIVISSNPAILDTTFTIDRPTLLNIVRTRDELVDHVLDLEEGVLLGTHYTGWDDPPLRRYADLATDTTLDAHALGAHNSLDEITGELIDLVNVNALLRRLFPMDSNDRHAPSSSWWRKLFK